MASYNKVIMIGNLTRDPQLSYLPSNTPVVEIGLANNRKWRDQSGQQREEVCFVDCKAFGKVAETINQYIHKGDPVLIEGRLTYDMWEGKDGQKRSKHRISIERFEFMASRQDSQQAPQQPQRPQRQPVPNDPPPMVDDDSGIPF